MAWPHDVVEIEEPIVNITSLSIKSNDGEKDCKHRKGKSPSLHFFHLFRYYILICILMIIFLGRILKEYKDSEREPKEV